MDKKLQILEAATKLFMEQGFGAVSMDMVTCEANVSKATLYVYFQSKNLLFTKCLQHFQDTQQIVYPQLPDKIPDTQQDLSVVLNNYLIKAFELYCNEAIVRMYRLLVGEIQQFPELFEMFFGNNAEQMTGNLCIFLTNYAKKHQFLSADYYFLACQILDMVRGATIWVKLVQNPKKYTLIENKALTIKQIHISTMLLINHLLQTNLNN